MRGQESLGGSLSRSCFLFIDESGDFNFTSAGTKYFVMAGVLTENPLQSARPLQDLRYRLLAGGINLSSFHAAPDLQGVRDLVFDKIASLSEIKAHVVFGKKEELHTSVKTMQEMHFHFTSALMRFYLEQAKVKESDQLIVVIDQSLPTKSQAAFKASIKPIIKRDQKKFHVHFQSMKADPNGQIADYIAWAKFKQLERGEHRPWELLARSIAPTEMELPGATGG